MIKEKMIPKGLSRIGRCRERGRGKKIDEKVLENRNGEIGESRKKVLKRKRRRRRKRRRSRR